jgi:hypothetical protein
MFSRGSIPVQEQARIPKIGEGGLRVFINLMAEQALSGTEGGWR